MGITALWSHCQNKKCLQRLSTTVVWQLRMSEVRRQIVWETQGPEALKALSPKWLVTWIRNAAKGDDFRHENSERPDVGLDSEPVVVGSLRSSPLDREASSNSSLVLIVLITATTTFTFFHNTSPSPRRKTKKHVEIHNHWQKCSPSNLLSSRSIFQPYCSVDQCQRMFINSPWNFSNINELVHSNITSNHLYFAA